MRTELNSDLDNGSFTQRPSQGDTLTWVLKVSKKCNLRCRYCYEFDHLADERRIAIADFPRLFKAALEISSHFGLRPKFCWHGGEPLLQDVKYFERAMQHQQSVWNGEQHPVNVVQTNLTVLDPSRLALLQVFDHVSISLDVFGDQRVAKNGRDVQDVVLRNMAELTNRGISFGAISVLGRHNIANVDNIFRFFNNSRVSFRLLPFYRSCNSEQASVFGLTSDEVAAAFERVVDLWFTENNGIAISPICDHIQAAVNKRFSRAARGELYDKQERERVLIVDTSGDVYGVADTYNPHYRYGNVLNDDISRILGSPGRRLAVEDSKRRMAATCAKCQYAGSCHGWWMAEATPLERSGHGKEEECVVARRTIQRAFEWLNELQAEPEFSGTAGCNEAELSL